MQFHRIRMTGFLSHVDTELQLDNITYASIMGHNGAGKSSIIQGIAWALFETKRSGGDSDSVVNDHADMAVVELDFSDNEGQLWRVKRMRQRNKKGGLKVMRRDKAGTWISEGDHTIASGQKILQEVFPLSEDAFYSFVVIDQASSGGSRFMASKPADRRSILISLIPDLAWWDKKHEQAKELRALKQDDKQRIEQTLLAKNMRIEEISGDGFGGIKRAQSKQFTDEQKAELDKTIETLEDERSSASERLGAATAGRQNLMHEKTTAQNKYELARNRLATKLEKANDVLTLLNTLQGKLDKYQDHLHKLESNVDGFKVQAKSVAKEIAQLEKKALAEGGKARELQDVANRLDLAVQQQESVLAERKKQQRAFSDLMGTDDGVQCWVCSSVLDHEKAEDLQNSIAASVDEDERRLAEMKRDLNSAKERFQDSNSNYTRLGAKLKTLQDKAVYTKTEMETTRGRIENGKAQIAEIENELSETQSKYGDAEIVQGVIDATDNEMRANDQQYFAVIEELDKALRDDSEQSGAVRIEREIASIDTKLKEARNKRVEAQNADRALESVMQELETLKFITNSLSEELAEAERQEGYARQLVAAMSPKGVPSMLLDNLLGRIEEKQNAILENLPGAEGMTMTFRMDRMNKSGKGSQDSLDVVVRTADGKERFFESFSFGERVRLNLANMFAMIEVLNENNPGLISSVFLDEPLGPVDQETVPALIEALGGKIREGVLDSIFIVTHSPQIIDSLPQRVSLSMSDKELGSQVEVAL